MKVFMIFLVLIGMYGVLPVFAYSGEVLIFSGNEIRKVYYNEQNVSSVVFDSDTGEVIFHTEDNSTLEVKAPKIFKQGPELFVLKDGEEIAPETTEDDCFYYIYIESQEPSEIEILFTFWPEYPETIKGCETFAVSPLKQQQLGVPLNEIKCKDGLVLLQKYDDSPACVKLATIPKLVERGWTSPVSEWSNLTSIIPEIGKFGTYELGKDGKKFDIKYHIKGGSDIREIISDENNAINIVLEPYDSGSLEITLSRELIDAKISEDVDDLFFVLIDGTEVPYTETVNETARILTIQFGNGSEIIEIIGTIPL